MGRICEHEFEIPDSDDPDYSHAEYDLYAKLGLTMRKNLRKNVYEIVTIQKPRTVKHESASLEEIAQIANDLEGTKNTVVECDSLCPKREMVI